MISFCVRFFDSPTDMALVRTHTIRYDTCRVCVLSFYVHAAGRGAVVWYGKPHNLPGHGLWMRLMMMKMMIKMSRSMLVVNGQVARRYLSTRTSLVDATLQEMDNDPTLASIKDLKTKGQRKLTLEERKNADGLFLRQGCHHSGNLLQNSTIVR